MPQKEPSPTKSVKLFWISIIIISALLIIVILNPKNKIADESEINADQLRIRTNLSTLAIDPDWSELEKYQKRITKKRFLTELKNVYSEQDAWKLVVRINSEYAEIRAKGNQIFKLQFGSSDHVPKNLRYWRKAGELPKNTNIEKEPLKDLRVAIDPGHIGGKWARMEGRWYQLDGKGIEIKEGELTLLTAKLIKQKLQSLGATVILLRDQHEPVTKLRPEHFGELARKVLQSRGQYSEGLALKRESELLFYRKHEIRRRAYIINNTIQPDLTICVHFNAESWGNPNKPKLINRNHLHLLVNGNYSSTEFRLEDNRFHLFKRLLQNTHNEELAVNIAVASSMANETGLPPYKYSTSNAKLINQKQPYIYARNLLANRIYHCPVIFLEPYVMNSSTFYHRVTAGNYSGEKIISGKKRKSLIHEYADGVVGGLVNYYKIRRKTFKGNGLRVN
ncbi:N-acetylmuramoyl-L-alanine amidase [Verrucomicrobiales bacterium]|nr:N-acetylmuramoyl-L-alanine amidase [Verrucomicrobiales bacterium]